MKFSKRITAVILSVMMVMTMMPAMAFAVDENTGAEAEAAEVAAEEAAAEEASVEETAVEADEAAAEDPEEVLIEEEPAEAAAEEAAEPVEEAVVEEEVFDEDESGMGYEELVFGQSIDDSDLEGTGAEQDELMDDFFMSDTPVNNDLAPLTPYSIKGNRLKGNSMKFYNYFKSVINRVSAAKTSAASMRSYKKVKLKTILGKRKFTAKELGVSRIGYKKNGQWYVSDAAMKKINALVSAPNWNTEWKKIYTSLLSDMSSKSYWVDWYSSSNPNNQNYPFIKWNCAFNYDSNSLTFKKSDSITFRLPVVKEFRYNGAAFKASKKKIKGAETAKNYAKEIVRDANSMVAARKNENWTNEEVDVLRLYYYCYRIAAETTYDDEAVQTNSGKIGGPWNMIPVFDKNANTKSVCAGYARAFKYLCDLSRFKSNWIDCQILTGSAGGQHMWNVVRMYDGLNYLVDPTWMDDDDNGTLDDSWFLRGDPNGTATYCTINGKRRSYDNWVIKTFAKAERKLAAKTVYEYVTTPRKIAIKTPKIKSPVRGKKKITVKWRKVTVPLGAVLVDGYQIQYGTKKSMKGAKKVTVKGYNKNTKTIRKLKARKYYYVRIRSYAKIGKKTYYSPWSVKKKVKTK